MNPTTSLRSITFRGVRLAGERQGWKAKGSDFTFVFTSIESAVESARSAGYHEAMFVRGSDIVKIVEGRVMPANYGTAANPLRDSAFGRSLLRGDARDQVRTVVALKDALDLALFDLVVELREEGASWGTIGDLLGVSRQAARQRFGTEGR